MKNLFVHVLLILVVYLVVVDQAKQRPAFVFLPQQLNKSITSFFIIPTIDLSIGLIPHFLLKGEQEETSVLTYHN